MTERGMYDQPGVPDVQAGTDIGPDGRPDFADEGCTGEGRGRGHTYTASEVKVLTETAMKFGYELGRKDAGEEIAEELKAYVANYPEDIFPPDGTSTDCIAAKAMRHAYPNAARIALEVSSQAAEDASDATSGVPGHPEVSEAVRSPQEPCGHPDCPIVLMHSHPEGDTL